MFSYLGTKKIRGINPTSIENFLLEDMIEQKRSSDRQRNLLSLFYFKNSNESGEQEIIFLVAANNKSRKVRIFQFKENNQKLYFDLFLNLDIVYFEHIYYLKTIRKGSYIYFLFQLETKIVIEKIHLEHISELLDLQNQNKKCNHLLYQSENQLFLLSELHKVIEIESSIIKCIYDQLNSMFFILTGMFNNLELELRIISFTGEHIMTQSGSFIGFCKASNQGHLLGFNQTQIYFIEALKHNSELIIDLETFSEIGNSFIVNVFCAENFKLFYVITNNKVVNLFSD